MDARSRSVPHSDREQVACHKGSPFCSPSARLGNATPYHKKCQCLPDSLTAELDRDLRTHPLKKFCRNVRAEPRLNFEHH